ncbi:MAG: aminopeptidase P family N-terminal domain-containing protein, partial [Actinomycetota bacterium]|nr:aminopeptidase P family N-terminal domain-containing protein [Actinomycetota bacterium]
MGAHERRVGRLRGELAGLGAATFLVTHPVNVRYLTGFESSNAAVLVGGDRLLLLTDGRYVAAARAVAGAEVVQADRELAPWLGKRFGELAEAPVAFESTHVTVAAHAALAQGAVDLLPAAGVIEELRSAKDEPELDTIRRAAEILTAALEEVARGTVVGRTEADVAWGIEQALHDAGADAPAFPPIVASGPNSALPH